MNTKALARHYDTLTPRERFPLIVTAVGRGDDLERDRLISSAPRRTYSIPHHWRLATRFESLSQFMLLKLLDLAACYLESFALSGEDDEGKAALDAALMLGYLFRAHRDGWHLFCAEVGVDPEHHWRRLPGLETVRSAEQLSDKGSDQPASGVVFLREEAARYLAGIASRDLDPDVADRRAKTIRVVTAEEIAASLRVLWKEYLERWG